MNEFLSLSVLGTFVGMVGAVTALTQVVKMFVPIDPKWIALLLSGICVVFAQIVLPGLVTYESIFLAFANWLMVTGSSIGLFEGVKSVGRKLTTPKQ